VEGPTRRVFHPQIAVERNMLADFGYDAVGGWTVLGVYFGDGFGRLNPEEQAFLQALKTARRIRMRIELQGEDCQAEFTGAGSAAALREHSKCPL